MYIEVTSQNDGRVATLLSPAHSSTANGTCYVSFWYNMYVGTQSQLDVGTTLFPSLWCRSGQQTSSTTWLRGEFWFFTETSQTFKVFAKLITSDLCQTELIDPSTETPSTTVNCFYTEEEKKQS